MVSSGVPWLRKVSNALMPEILVVTSACDHSPARTNSKGRGKQIWHLERAFDLNAKQLVLCLISKVANGRITGRIEKIKIIINMLHISPVVILVFFK